MDDGTAPELAPVPWRWVGAIAGATTLLLLLVARRYGWHRDELYFLEAGTHHLAWGYVDQPPFTPLLARLADWIAPGNLVVLRTPPAITTGVTVALGALIARELGGDRRAQIAAAAALACCGFPLGVGHLLSTAAFDLTFWMALLWVTARLLRTDDPRWWIAFGAIAGVALWNKHLPVLLAITVLAGLALARHRRVLLTPWLPAGGALAVLIVLPNLLWQADHDWPQLEMAQALSDRLAVENRVTLLPLQLLFGGPLLALVLWGGARALFRDQRLTPFRALLWMWPIGLAITLATAGRPYYVMPLTVVVLLAGVVAFVWRGRQRRLVGLLVASTVTAIPLALPLLPTSAIEISGAVNEAAVESIGWPELVDQIAAVVHGLPAAEQADVVILALTYGEAGAVDRFGPARGLPPAYSGHNSYADFRQPTDPGATVVAVRFSLPFLERRFVHCDQVATVDNGHDVDNEVQGEPIAVCRGLREPWPETWEGLRRFS